MPKTYQNDARCRVAVPGFGAVRPGARVVVKGKVPPAVSALVKAKILSEVAKPKPTPKEEPVRARKEDGTFQSDDPATPEVNEAWDPPKKATPKKAAPKKRKKATKKAEKGSGE